MSFEHSRHGPFLQPRADILMRYMFRRDMPEVLEIERQSFEYSWTEEDFLCCLRQRNCIGMVAECKDSGRVTGFMVYELLKSQLHVLNFAVPPWARRRQVGTQMIEKLINKLSRQLRQEILLEVRETNLAAQLFFRSQGLRAYGVLRGHYEDTYVMWYQLYPADEVFLPLPFNPKAPRFTFPLGKTDDTA